MRALKTALEELIGLFVDDGTYAAAIVACLLIAGFVFARIHVTGSFDWRGPVLFVGLSAVMVVSVVRTAGKK